MVELGTAWVSILGDTKELRRDIQKALDGVDRQGRDAGNRMGSAMSAAVSGQMGSGARGAAAEFTNYFQTESVRRGEKVGKVIGTAVGGAIVGAAGLATAGAGAILFKGLDRYKSLDATAKRLGAMGKSAGDVKAILSDINDVVEGTPIALDEASKSATQFLAAGVKQGNELKGVLTAIADAAGFSGDGFDSIAQGFIQVNNAGKLTAEDLQNQFQNLPLVPWLAKSMGTDPASIKTMVSNGQIGIQQVIDAVEQNAGGMAKAAGDTIDGALRNISTGVARTGANLLSAIFGDPLDTTQGPGGMVEALNKVNGKIVDLNNWVVGHKDEIRGFFTDAAEAAKTLATAVGEVGTWMANNKDVVVAIGIAFGTWKIAGLLNDVRTLGGLLGGAAAARAGGAAAAGAGGAGILGQLGTAAALAGAGSVAAVGIGSQQAADQGYKPVLEGRFPEIAKNTRGNAGKDPASIFGSGSAQRERRGASPSSLIGGSGTATGGVNGAGFSASTPEGWRPLVQQTLAQYGPQFGITNTKAWEDAIIRQIGTESGGNANVGKNLTDSNAAAGHPSEGLLQFIPGTFAANNITGGSFTDPAAQIAALIPYVMNKYGVDRSGAPLQIGRGVGYQTGGPVAGKPGPDQIMAWLSDGEHVWTADEVAAVGGQDKMMQLRAMASSGQLTPESVSGMVAGPQGVDATGRTEGYIPAGAGYSGKTGGGVAGSLIGLGGEAIKGAIQTAADAGKVAASVGSFGAAAAGGPAAGMGIQMGADIGKRLVDYGTEMAGIGIGAASEILLPFGAPRWLSDVDPTSFVPHTGIQGAATTTAEQAVLDQQAQNGVDPNTTQHGQAMGAPPGPDPLGNTPTPELEPAAEIRGGDTINLYPKDVDESFRLLNQRQKLQSMQYGGRP